MPATARAVRIAEAAAAGAPALRSALSLCLAPAPECSRISAIIDTVIAAPTGRALAELAALAGYTIHFDSDQTTSAQMSHAARRIALQPRYPDAVLVYGLAHELRHVGQGLLSLPFSERDLAPADRLDLARAREADADTVAALISWELAALGAPEYLGDLDQHPRAAILRALRDEAEADPFAIHGMNAPRAAFDAWYGQEHLCRHYDEAGLHLLEEQRHEMLVRARIAPAEPLCLARLERLGELPGGGNYLAATGGFDPAGLAYRAHRGADFLQRLDRLAEVVEAAPRRPQPAPPRPTR